MITAQPEISTSLLLLERISEARRRSDALFGIVQPPFLFERPIPERHRIIFYLGHLEAFDWNLLHDSALGLKSFHSEFDRLFAFGIDPVGGGLPSDQPSEWPSHATVLDYVRKIRAALDEKLARVNLDSDDPVRDGFPLKTLLNVAIEHRLMHLETLAYMLHQLPLGQKIKHRDSAHLAPSPLETHMVPIPAGETSLGLSRSEPAFGWDNEFEAHTVAVPSFEMDRYMVSNQQFLAFMNAGGYESRDLWSDGDWKWKADQQISQPVFWSKGRDRWLYRSMFEEIPLPPDWPVYVSHAEAAAYARWAGKSLPTEQQWHRAAYGTPQSRQRYYPWGNEAPEAGFGNFDFVRWDPAPVNACPRGQSAFGVEGMLGNGWEWTSTVFSPFPGF